MTQIDQETTLKAITRFAATARDVRGSVGEREERETAERFVVEINRAINPPRALSADQVIVRSLLLASDATNHYGGRFAGDELRRIAELAVDSPVLVGHRKDTLPIARVFRASVINHEGQRWAKAFFYWLRESSGSETLAANIDGGVYKECSLGFTFLRAECSICGADIRSCPHTPDAAIPDSVRSKQSDGQDCVYYYRDIRRVLEISLVYRGAIPHTRIGAALGFAESNLCDDSSEVSDEPTLPNHGSFLKRLRLERVSALAAQGPGEAEPDGILTQLPAFPASVAGAELYEGLPVLVGRSGGKMFVLRDDGVDAPQRLFEAALGAGEYPREDFLLYGRLIGMRGKQRRSLSELARRLNSNAGPVRSYRLRLIAFLYLNHAWLDEANSASFRQECGRLCRDQRRLVESSVANCEGPGERPNDVRGREIVLTGRPGEFCFLRLSNTPLTLARNLPLSSNVPATLTLEHSPLSERMADAGRSAGADTVQLRFDDVSENHGRLSLINPRVGARLGELCAEENYLLFNAGPRQTCRKRDDFLRITDTAGATHSVALAESYEGNAGLVHILAEIGRTVTDGVQTAAVIPGATVRLANQNGAVSPMRVIQLDCGKTTRLALIHSAEAPDARAG